MEERYTNIRLLKVPIEIDNKNQLDFENATTQYNYFNNCVHIDLDDSSYQRKDNTIRYPGHIDDLIGFNYCMYKNAQYSNKWYYAFITDMRYMNDEMTLVTIKTDVWQTWWNDIEIKRSFVEREHVNDDTIGLHTIPEQLETGEHISSGVENLYNDNETYICISCSDLPGDLGRSTSLRYNGVYSGTDSFLFDGAQGATNFIQAMDEDEKYLANAIVSIYLVPTSLYSGVTLNWQTITINGITTRLARIPSSDSSVLLSTSSSLTPPSSIDGYTPKNNKLKVFPYSYLYVTNNAGGNAIYKYEDFINNTAQFKTYGSLTPGCSIRTIPIDYKKLDDTSSSLKAYEYGINVGKFPVCSWSNDTYTNWLTSNTVNIGFKTVGGILGIIGGGALMATGAGATVGAGILAGGVGMITDSVKEIYNHSLIADQASGNTNSGDVTYSTGMNKVVAYKMNIRNEYAKVIDEFFSMFGYKVNRVKTPNITGRTNWNYVKTIDCNIHAFIPQKDCIEIKNMFNAGVTFWHNPSTFLDYSQTNNIAS